MVAQRQAGDGVLDLAVIGAGVAGTYVAQRVQVARPDWSITLFERTERIGGRLRSMKVPGLDHPIELGGMRFLTSQPRVAAVVAEIGLPTHPFDSTRVTEVRSSRSLRRRARRRPARAHGYDLPAAERVRSESALEQRGRVAAFAADQSGTEAPVSSSADRLRSASPVEPRVCSQISSISSIASIGLRR